MNPPISNYTQLVGHCNGKTAVITTAVELKPRVPKAMEIAKGLLGLLDADLYMTLSDEHGYHDEVTFAEENDYIVPALFTIGIDTSQTYTTQPLEDLEEQFKEDVDNAVEILQDMRRGGVLISWDRYLGTQASITVIGTDASIAVHNTKLNTWASTGPLQTIIEPDTRRQLILKLSDTIFQWRNLIQTHPVNLMGHPFGGEVID